MNKFTLSAYAFICVFVLGSVAGTVDTTLTQKETRDPRVLETYLESNFVELNARTVPHQDTNATTVVTAYTPAAIGHVLIGNTGGTNYIWMAYGTTTNDWKLIHP